MRNGSTFSASTPSPGAGITSDTTTSSDGGRRHLVQIQPPLVRLVIHRLNTTTSGTSQPLRSERLFLKSCRCRRRCSGVTGASYCFQAKLWLEKELLVNARLIWNFGDGAIAEGLSVLHTYVLPDPRFS